MSNKPLVYKFGGASVKDASAIKNLAQIIIQQNIQNDLIIVVSAMGKMTNAFEKLINELYNDRNYENELNEIKLFHLEIINELFNNVSSPINDFTEQFHLLEAILQHTNKTDYDFIYDQIVCYGELFSTKIIANYFLEQAINNDWVDARRCILTDNTHRNANVNYDWSTIFTKKNILPILENKIVITQGFIGSDADGNTTSLGREGSDFSAAILAHCIDAESVTIWKDVDGVLNGDPKKIKAPIKYDRLSYEEVIEMSYYGATVIHPKTIKPLANKNIPLFVRSFIKPNQNGTEIGVSNHQEIAPCVIIKEDQALISFRKKDLSFMEETNIFMLIENIAELDLKINLVQKSALNLSIVTNFEDKKIDLLIKKIKDVFFVHYNTSLQLITIKNYKTLEIPEEIKCTEVLLEQKTRKNIQYLVK